ncbi:MAG: DUF2461 domain-containing protein [Pseudomonadota bacterium]
MSDSFAALIQQANDFFSELAANNTKEWFEPRKAQYKAEIRAPAELLADLFAEDLSRLTGASYTAKVFRIYRDVRFSKDKSPYNPHLHMSWKSTGHPEWFFGSSPSYCVLCTGLPDLKGEKLTAYRVAVDQDGDDLSDIIDAVASSHGARFSNWGADPLKRVPKPYDTDHPHADLLKRKSLILEMTPDLDGGVLSGLGQGVDALLPFWRALNDMALT